jgi:hypothetical protein
MYNFAFKLRTSDMPGQPLTIKGGTLDDRFDPKALQREKANSWHKPVHSIHYPPAEALSFPNTLWLNTGEKSLDFDFRLDMNGIIFSERFLELCQSPLTEKFKIAELNVVNRKNETIMPSRMYYAKPSVPQNVVDRDKSVTSIEILQTSLLPVEVEVFRSLSLRTDIEDEMVFPIDIDDCVLVESSLAKKLEDAKLKGLELVDQDAFCERYNDRLTIRNREGKPLSAFG